MIRIPAAAEYVGKMQGFSRGDHYRYLTPVALTPAANGAADSSEYALRRMKYAYSGQYIAHLRHANVIPGLPLVPSLRAGRQLDAARPGT